MMLSRGMHYLIRFHEAGREAQPQRHKVRRDIVANINARLPDAQMTTAVGRVFVTCQAEPAEVLAVFADLYGVTSFSPCRVCSLDELSACVIEYAREVLPGVPSYRLSVKRVSTPEVGSSLGPSLGRRRLAVTLGAAIAEHLPEVKVDLRNPALAIGIEIRGAVCRIYHQVIAGRERSDRQAPQRQAQRLLVDQMLGHLVSWLRLLGLDTTYVRDHPDTVLLRMAEDEGRMVITRDGPLAEVRAANTTYIQADDPSAQLREVIERLGLRVSRAAMFTRCTLCNGPVQHIARDRVRERIPPIAYETYDEFTICRACDKVYWKGGQYQTIVATLADLLVD